ncbi:MAG: hypothetical protein NC079_02710 [Clostridium sp.]|nr:hypothetical protein [Acetatifactor muris]MCM1527174.1 hypothetical protein [Bacteroides sp.]MCM1562501.1 hypothetical protein [Clostridium sp.]
MLHKAFICPYNGLCPQREDAHAFHVPFNPSELMLEEAVGLTDSTGEDYGDRVRKRMSGMPIGWQQPVEGSLGRRRKNRVTLSMTLFFNTLTGLDQSSYEDVRNYIRKLYYYDNRDIGGNRKPQQICFEWGSISVAGILTRLGVHYTMFSPEGIPVRAQAEISIEGEYYGEKEGRSPGGIPKSGGARSETKEIDRITKEGWDKWRKYYTGSGNPRLLIGRRE